jgi:hypothetical protein
VDAHIPFYWPGLADRLQMLIDEYCGDCEEASETLVLTVTRRDGTTKTGRFRCIPSPELERGLARAGNPLCDLFEERA